MVRKQNQDEEDDWGDFKDDMDASDWELYLGGPDDDSIESPLDHENEAFCDETYDHSELETQSSKAKSSFLPRARPMTVKEYLDVGSGYCPACGSGELRYAITQLDGNEAWTNSICKDCEVEWQISWQLKGYSGAHLASPQVGISTDYALKAAWHRALNTVFINDISEFIPELVSYFRAIALQTLWVSQGADVASSDKYAIDMLRSLPFSLTHAGTPKSKIYGMLAMDVMSDLMLLYTTEELEVPDINRQKNIIRRAGYRIVPTEPGSWQIEEVSGLRLPGIFQGEDAAVKACYFLQLSIRII